MAVNSQLLNRTARMSKVRVLTTKPSPGPESLARPILNHSLDAQIFKLLSIVQSTDMWLYFEVIIIFAILLRYN